MIDKDYLDFETLVEEYFRSQQYEVQPRNRLNSGLGVDSYDLKVIKEHPYLIEVKFYRTTRIHRSLLVEIATKLAYWASREPGAYGIVVISTDVADELIEEVYNRFRIRVWDRGILFAEFAKAGSGFLELFEMLLLGNEQGTDASDISKWSAYGRSLRKQLFPEAPPVSPEVPESRDASDAKVLLEELGKLKCGKGKWSDYEKLVTRILKLLFARDLSVWEQQARSDDSLSRFDLICRIGSIDDFWKSLVRAFNTRFVLFEFKNYCEKITQHEVYMTERYLYRNALRSVAVVISRKGPNDSAVQAAKGALRENGKLIFFLDDADLIKMLQGVGRQESSNDYMAKKLDDWLIGLSR